MSEIIENEYPVNFNPKDEPKFVRFKKYTVPSFQVIHEKNHYLTPSGILFSIKGMVYESIFPEKHTYFLKIAIGNFLFRKRQTIEEPVLIIHNICSIGGYYHWLLESLVRLLKCLDNSPTKILLLPERTKGVSFIQESLKAFPLREIQYYSNDRIARLSDVTTAANPRTTGYHNAALLFQLRKQLIAYQEANFPEDGSIHLKVYISRQKARSRRIINQGDVELLLENHGFKTYYFEELSFWEQVVICKNASMIISPHGAALSNILFMNKGCHVIELLSEKVTQFMIFWSLASTLQLKYHYLLCEQENELDSFDQGDVVVPTKKLKLLLNSL